MYASISNLVLSKNELITEQTVTQPSIIIKTLSMYTIDLQYIASMI